MKCVSNNDSADDLSNDTLITAKGVINIVCIIGIFLKYLLMTVKFKTIGSYIRCCFSNALTALHGGRS